MSIDYSTRVRMFGFALLEITLIGCQVDESALNALLVKST